MQPIIPKSIAAAAAFAAVLCLNSSAGYAAGWRHEPWCAVFEYDDITFDCSYRTFAECYPNVIGGIRGTCSPNPDGASAQTPASAPSAAPKHKKQHAQR